MKTRFLEVVIRVNTIIGDCSRTQLSNGTDSLAFVWKIVNTYGSY